MGNLRGCGVRVVLFCAALTIRGGSGRRPRLGANVSRQDSRHGDGHKRRRHPQREGDCAQHGLQASNAARKPSVTAAI